MQIFGPVFLAAFILQGAFAQSAPAAASSAQSPPSAQSATSSTKPATSDAQVTSVKIEKVGIFSAASGTSQKPAAEGIPFAAVQNVHLTRKTTTVPIAKGLNFGFEYEAIGKPLGERATLHFVVIYPPPGLHKPGSSSPLARDEYDRKVRIGVKNRFDGYELDNDWELVPGSWTLEIMNGSTTLASETFTLVKP